MCAHCNCGLPAHSCSHDGDRRSHDCTGSRLGRQLAERYTQDRARMTEQLDVIKWACKELWGEVFHKQVRCF
jgi:Transport protein particle (TRAPP) component